MQSQKRVSGNPPQRYVCVTHVFVRAAFLESVHYLEQVITSVVEKKRIILMIKTSRFTGKSGSRIEDWLEKIVDRGDMGRRL